MKFSGILSAPPHSARQGILKSFHRQKSRRKAKRFFAGAVVEEAGIKGGAV